MVAATLERPTDVRAGTLVGPQLFALARLACEGGATRSEVARDLAAIGSCSKAALDKALATLKAHGLISEARGRMKATPAGLAAVASELGSGLPTNWPLVRGERLVAKALGLVGSTPQRIKALTKPAALRAEVLARAFKFKPKGASPARLRTQLAVVALERAFGNSIKGELGSGRGFAPKASRLLAAQLLRKPRDPRTDQRLIAALAAEQVGLKSDDAEALQIALLRELLARRPDREPKPLPDTPAEPVEIRAEILPRPPAANRPDLRGFARAVQLAARGHAEGWPGMRKAFISHVWEAIAASHAAWGLSEVEFKAMLAEAHRTGHVALVNADLKDKSRIRELQASAVAYKNAVWHFVRVQD
jgi:hypothetical protein